VGEGWSRASRDRDVSAMIQTQLQELECSSNAANAPWVMASISLRDSKAHSEAASRSPYLLTPCQLWLLCDLACILLPVCKCKCTSLSASLTGCPAGPCPGACAHDGRSPGGNSAGVGC
jgi:hypothetical protein